MIARPFILRRRRRKSFETMRERQTLQTTLSIAGPLSKENYSLRLPDSTTVELGVIGQEVGTSNLLVLLNILIFIKTIKNTFFQSLVESLINSNSWQSTKAFFLQNQTLYIHICLDALFLASPKLELEMCMKKKKQQK